MRRIILFSMLVGVWLMSSFDFAPDYYGDYKPVFMERAELERSVKYADEPREMTDPGKLWISGSDIFVVERYKGIHIIDNANPSSPYPKAYIVAPGCIDIAVKGNIIYLDNAVDFVAFDLASGRVTERMRNFFPEPASPSGDRYSTWDRPQDLILVGWKGVTR